MFGFPSVSYPAVDPFPHQIKMTRMPGRFLQHVHHDPPKAYLLPEARLPGTQVIQ